MADDDLRTPAGTLAPDRAGDPRVVHAHEREQLLDRTVEAVPLPPDLPAAAGPRPTPSAAPRRPGRPT